MLIRLVAFIVIVLAAAGWNVSPARAEEPSAPGHAGTALKAEAPETGAPHAGESKHGGEAKHGSEEGGEISPLSFQSNLAIWTFVIFLVVLAILWRFAWGPIAQGLEKRERQIADQISQAERSNQEARQLLADYQQKLAASRDEVRAILDQGRRDAEQVGHEMIEKARTDAAAEHQRGVQQIEAATAAALKELAERSATLAVELAGKIVRTRLNPSDHAKLIQEAVAGFTTKKNGHG